MRIGQISKWTGEGWWCYCYLADMPYNQGMPIARLAKDAAAVENPALMNPLSTTISKSAASRSICLVLFSWPWNLQPWCQHDVVRRKCRIPGRVPSPLHLAEKPPNFKVRKKKGKKKGQKE